MGIQSNIRKILMIFVWCITGAGALALLIAAINMKNSKTCKRYSIAINEKGRAVFIDQKMVANILTANGSEKIVGKELITFDLRKLEDRLKKNAWIKDAQLFFDNNQTLRINITERVPVARIFTTGGLSFYIDSSCAQLPLAGAVPLRLPVFTNFPREKIKLSGQDSLLSDQVRKLSTYINKDPFWMSDIEQVNITPDKKFQIVPLIGNHIVEFGDGEDYEKKFHRLFVFYKEVLSKTGFDRYSRIDVEYKGQVIGTKKGSNISRTDSLQAMKNILALIKSAREMQVDTVKQNIKPLEHNTVTEQTLTNYDMINSNEDSVKK
ncbi:MAG: FtsQ-type POTRA domain-containing protein [Bacteroidetes bacterium]|nr:FtsQ-type POTRA domain-containing protein [Bacteroidota bacterium]